MTYTGKPGARVKTIEVDTGLGNNVDTPFTVTVVDDDIIPGSLIIATQSGEASEGKSQDENEFDHFTVSVSVSPEGGSMVLIIRPLVSIILSGKYKINYMIG